VWPWPCLVDISKEKMSIMGSKRREFTLDYKDKAVKLVTNTGRPVAIVARELGTVEQTFLGDTARERLVQSWTGP
jgi:transposase-like protein